MKLFRKIKSAIRRFRLLQNPEKWPSYVHDNLVGYLILKKINYLENKNTHYIQTGFNISESRKIDLDYFVEGPTYFYRGVIMEGIPEERMRDAMVMSAHLNNKLRTSQVYVNPDHRVIFAIVRIDMPTCVLYPGTMFDLLGAHFDECVLSLEAFEKLFNSDDDPIFIIADLIDKMNSKTSKGSSDHNSNEK